MSVGCILVNYTRKEKIIFLHLPVNTMAEIMRNEVSALIVRWYREQHAGDEVALVSDTDDDWPFSGGSGQDLRHTGRSLTRRSRP